jgi:anaerobic selenocysteine-containing dehydrogenase
MQHFNTTSENVFETVEIDPQYAQALGLLQGDLVRFSLSTSAANLSYTHTRSK